MNGDSIIN